MINNDADNFSNYFYTCQIDVITNQALNEPH